jgi:hypothetical protein
MVTKEKKVLTFTPGIREGQGKTARQPPLSGPFPPSLVRLVSNFIKRLFSVNDTGGK